MKRLAAGATLLALIAAAVTASGVISIKASSRHWAVTSWVLDFAKRRSVSTRSIGVEPPPLEDEALVRLGAAHYDRGCRPCHGIPGDAPPVVPARMTPHPPDLGRQIARWQPREIHYIVTHGIKFTGMPAWPSPFRDDEVWAVVAFVRTMPGMDATAYARLVSPDPAAPAGDALGDTDPITSRCGECHRSAERGRRSPLVPVLAGQQPGYIRAALDAYADGRRHSGIMGPIAASLSRERREAVARRIGIDGADAVAARLARPAAGASIITAGDPAREIPPCAACHGPSADARNPDFPRLAGQPEAYLRRQLRLFAENRRGGSPYADIMRDIAMRLTPEHIAQATRAYADMTGDQP
jgi:cytochrome c553